MGPGQAGCGAYKSVGLWYDFFDIARQNTGIEVGAYELIGYWSDTFDIARTNTEINISDSYGFNIVLPIANIVAGQVFNHTIKGPLIADEIQGTGFNLNVNLYPDGTGAIGEGSYYPDVDLIAGTCITAQKNVPVTDNFNWETVGGQEGNSFPVINIIGLPSANGMAGTTAYGLGVNGSGVFDNWGSAPIQIPTPSVLPAITPDGVNFLALGCAGICASGAAGPYDECMAGCSVMPEAYGAMLPGDWGGYYRQGDLGKLTNGSNT